MFVTDTRTEQVRLHAQIGLRSPRFTQPTTDESIRTVVEWFERQVNLMPDQDVVRSLQRGYTYAKLNQAANQVAHTLLSRSGSKSEAVALYVSHDVEAVAALLGALKSGKYYVPLDPAYPLERLKFIVGDSAATSVVTTKELAGMASYLTGPETSLLVLEDMFGSGPSSNPNIGLTPDHLAYLLYTSGSTGSPKGVIEDHRHLLNSTRAFIQRDFVSPDDVLSGFISLNVAASAINLFMSLTTGAELVLADPKRLGMQAIADLIRQRGITQLNTTPTLFRAIAEADRVLDGFPTLRALRVGGAPVTAFDLASFREHLNPGCYIRNSYGMSEVMLICSYLFAPGAELPQGAVPIGYEVPGTEVSLVDEDDRPVSQGEIGEIVVRGPHVGPGYWNRPDLNSVRFSRNPASGSGRCFRTGDLGVRDENGCLFHKGRRDFQVKVRGYRVELQDVEESLGSLPGVKAAAARAWDGTDGETYLAAYVVPNGVMPPTVDLRRDLAAKLPGHMVPAVFVAMSELPVTPNGKLDRKALQEPRPEQRRGDDQATTRLPTELEWAITLLWSEVLQTKSIGLHDEFLDLGGDSLKASRLITRVEDRFKVKVPFAEFFEATTVEAQGSLVSRLLGGNSHVSQAASDRP